MLQFESICNMHDIHNVAQSMVIKDRISLNALEIHTDSLCSSMSMSMEQQQSDQPKSYF